MIKTFEEFIEENLNERKVLSTKRHYVHNKKQALTSHNILKKKGYVRKFTTVKNKSNGSSNYIHHYIHKKTGDIRTIEVNDFFHPEK